MSKFRFFSIVLGGGLLVLGLIISLVAAVNIIAEAPPPSMFDQTDDVLAPENGIAPIIVPTIPLVSTEPKDEEHYATAKAITSQDPAVSLPTSTIAPASDWIPDRIVIPAIQLDAPAIPATLRLIAYLGKTYPQWIVPNFFAVGWATTSASLGTPGNTVFFGHHNADGEVFAHLVDLQVNDLITLYSGEKKFTYIIVLKMILPERNQPIDIRLQNAAWILPSADERITLLTCWPYASNTHRLIIVAVPVSADQLESDRLIPRLTPLPTHIPK